MAQFRDQFYALCTPWLRTGNAEKYIYSMQLAIDVLLEKQDQASQIGMPGRGDVSQIPYLANDRLLVQGPGESNTAFLGRLQQAFAINKRRGSRRSVLEQLQAYMQGLQPGVAAVLPEMAIVGGNASVTTWSTLYQGDAIGAFPTLQTVPSNWNWDGVYKPWRAWLILYMSQVATGLSGSSAATTTSTGPAGGTGHNVGGVWVPDATVLGTPFLTITGLSGLTSAQVGQWLTLSGSAHTGNNGVFYIDQVFSATSCEIANPNGVTADAGPLTWSIGFYPFIGPGPAWGSPGINFGQGELITPPVSTGARVGGIWEPNIIGTSTSSPSVAWGLSCRPDLIQALRAILLRCKSAGTYYPVIIVAFDGGDGTAGKAFSPLSSPGSGNPDGTFGDVGSNNHGVWRPTRLVTSPYDAYCQGSGSWPAGGVEVT